MENFKEINEYPASLTVANTLLRMIDGIGFRYYWGTQGISESDLSFSPGNEGRTMHETLHHIHYMCLFIANSLEGKVTSFPEPASSTPFPDVREETLGTLNQIRTLLTSSADEDLEVKNLKIAANGNSFETPIWHLINGPILDMSNHLGQLIMMRRANGNPIDARVQPFFCKIME